MMKRGRDKSAKGRNGLSMMKPGALSSTLERMKKSLLINLDRRKEYDRIESVKMSVLCE